ncbi:MAG: RagB/SusD family nutrient uptake outer membrane protein [Bacteroidales bacterium]
MKKILIIFSIISLLSYSCTDLNEVVYENLPGDVYPENELQVAGLSVNAYLGMKDLIDDNGWWFLAQELSSDEFCGPTRDADWFDGGKWINMHQHTWSNDDEGVNRMWDKMWSGIIVCNITLDQLRQLPESDAVEAKINEVETMRSFYYYLLIDNYGDVPYITSASDTPEQPFKLTREAIFDSLTSTIEAGLSSLKPIDKKYLATRYMAYALLAKLYINAEVYTGTQQWAKADAYIDSVLAGPYSLANTVSDPFLTNNENSSEIIFSIPFEEDTYQGFRIHMRTLHYHHNLTYDMPVGPWNGLSVTPTHFNTYENTDLRKEAYFIYGPQYASTGSQIIDGGTKQPLVINPILPALYMTAADYTVDQYRNSGARVGKYEIKMGAKENLSNDFPLFRITDFYLMKAETQIRLGGPGDGDSWINEIRDRADVGTWTGATLDQLLAERGRELFCEGHRRQDLIRFGKFTDIWWAKGDVQGGVAGDPSVLTFPIPKYASDANPNLLLDPQ